MRLYWLAVGTLTLTTCSLPLLAARAASPKTSSPQTSQEGSQAAVDGVESTPATLLRRAAEAAQNTNFQGVLVYRGAGATEVLHVTHRFKDGQQSEHLITLTGVPRELIRIGNRLTCLLPRGHQLRLQRPSDHKLLGALRGPGLVRVAQWYRFSSLEAARIAGRKCLGVAVEPRDAYRYGYRLWLDAATQLPLRVMLMGSGERVLEQVMFTQVSFPKTIPDSAFKPQFEPSEGYHLVQQELSATPPGAEATSAAQQAAELWRFSNLPPGFRITLRDQGVGGGGAEAGRADHLVLSDGLSSVSVFSRPVQLGQPELIGLSHLGAVHAYGRTVGGYHVTVVGEAPGRTVRAIGAAITPTAAANAASAQAPRVLERASASR